MVNQEPMMKLTKEQKKIVRTDLAPGQVMKIMAFAGTGKTTTLLEYTKKRPDTKFLYIAFNKSVQLEAQARFPGNVTARTCHALAFRHKGFKYKDRMTKGFRANQVMAALGLEKYEDARFTIDTLQNYLVSPDPKVAKKHIPASARIFYKKNSSQLPDLVDFANKLGRLMCDGTDDTIGMLHDGYLKLFQLSGPTLPFDCILLDEAQDINPVTAEIVFAQADKNRRPKPASIILVGDNHQQIYSFRGAKDALKGMPAAKTQYLTRSFRFDDNIAKVANMILNTFKKETRKIKGTPVKRLTKAKWNPKKYTVIARTNAVLFDKAIRLYKKVKIGFVGGAAGYRLDILKDVWNLYQNERSDIRDPYIKGFKSFDDLQSYARSVEDFELLSVCRMVEKYTSAIPRHVKQILAQAENEKEAQVLLTTAHKAKGLEWDNVLLMGDFHPLVKEGALADPSGIDPDEFNLIYVAATRAMTNLRFDKESDIPDFIRLYLSLA